MHIVQVNKKTMDNIKGKSCLQIYEDTYTEDEYLNISWPAIEYVLNTFLNEQPGKYAPIKYEEIYCHIYKCVCKDYRERLYDDLIAFVSKHIDNTCKNLQNMSYKSIKESNDLVDYLKVFYLFLNQYKTGTGAILAIFHYLNINYVRQKLGSDLSIELNSLLTTRLIDSHIIQILDGCLKLGGNFEEISNLINALYLIKKDYAYLNKDLFKKYSKAYSDNLNECLGAENSSNIDINGNHDIEVDSSMDHDDCGLSHDDLSKLSILNGKQRKRHADDRTNEPHNKMFC